MAQYQKFMFDNFIISCEDEKCVAEPVDIAETTLSNPAAEDAVPAVDEPQEEALLFAAPPVAYTQEQLDAEIKKAEERGYERGFQTASGDAEKQEQELLGTLNARLLTMLSDAETLRLNLEQDSLRFALEVVRKVLPTLEPQQAAAEIENFLAAGFPNFRAEAGLIFTFNPAVVGQVSGIIAKLANANDFEGKISVHKDVSLGLSDCRIEWKNGGVERSSHKMLEKIDNLRDDKSQQKQERENG